jgi:hypothetical protein
MMEALATLAALLDRTINEVKVLDGDLQKRITDAVQKREESIRAETTQQLEAQRREIHNELTRRFEAELHSALNSLRADFQAERDRWSSESGVERERLSVERERLNKELQLAGDTASELQVERSKLTAELQRVREESAAEISRLRAAADKAVAAATAAAKVQPPVANDEITRVQSSLAEVVAIIDDPMTELSVVIRKNVEKLELEAYLKGLKYIADRK